MTVATGRPKGGARTPDIEQRKRRIELYEPHAGQLRLHNSKARFRIACAGRRFGKTYACINEVAKFAWEHPGNATEHVSWWVAPTYNQAAKALNVFLIFFKDAIASHRMAVGQMTITWKNGSVTCFQSSERYDNLRGEGVEFMVVDEAAMVPKAAWEKVLRPMLTETLGRAILISTPRGKNWFYLMYKRGLDEKWPDYESFSFPTSESPYIEQSEVDEAQLTLPEDVFAQEYLGAFLDEAAGVFHNVEGCVDGEFAEYDPLHRYVIGWDIAKSQDWSVVTVFDCDNYEPDPDGRDMIVPHVAHWERFNNLRYDVQIERVAGIAKKYGAYILLDSTGLGDPIY
ncbi:MAG TPA: terminase family protein, partial [Thermoleophilia bacterium]|nr:terminase family protein [Thermoleophilia bacterium]